MKVFVAGASGAIGRPLMALLTAAGHEVIGMVRSAEGAARLRRRGVEAVAVDALDRDAVRAALCRAAPAVVVDEITSLPKSPADLAQALPGDRRLRLEGGSAAAGLAGGAPHGCAAGVSRRQGLGRAARE